MKITKTEQKPFVGEDLMRIPIYVGRKQFAKPFFMALARCTKDVRLGGPDDGAIRFFDPSRVTLTTIEAPNLYTTTEEMTLSTSKLTKIAARGTKGDVMILRATKRSEITAIIWRNGVAIKSYTLNTSKNEVERPSNLPKMDHKAAFIADPKLLLEICADAAVVDMPLTFVAKSGLFQIECDGAKFMYDEVEFLKDCCDARSIHALRHFTDLLPFAKIAEELNIKWGMDAPLALSLFLPEGFEANRFIAPRIEPDFA
jgi:hypothetical protein